MDNKECKELIQRAIDLLSIVPLTQADVDNATNLIN